ncbi:IS4-like element ISWosp2 family transposase [Wolbachia endosymbiont (group B) of Tholera decimalis]|uniref:IS4-like element ISWosp2 family transposase n=1 Tax=Wolbachia endosymbiont (group B) of Tholera decimalis TaxID=3066181 RepID=UPI00334249C4
MANRNNEWAENEFGDAVLGDKRLTDRLVNIADSFTSLPESSINQACGSWSEAKAAYRFFQNENVKEGDILASHVAKTVERTKAHKKIFVIQDTSYISYTDHEKTSGLGVITRKHSQGIIMHTALAVSIEGLVLGILDQKIYSRPEESENIKKKNNDSIRIEDKESIKWLETLSNTNNIIDSTQTETITICDREADIYEFFELAYNLNSAVLVRASKDRAVNRKSRYPEKGEQKLWEFIKSSHCAGTVKVEVPAKDNKPKRTAHLEVRFGKFIMHPSKNSIRHKTEELLKLPHYAVYVVEKDFPSETNPLEWMLLTNLPVNTFDEAVEKVRWYCLRWKIEILHKILKSGLKVEECRLGTAERLMRYLTVMSIIAWRIFFITTIARTDPTLPCTTLLAEEEWKVLYVKIHRKPCSNATPTIKEAVSWVAQLGGHLARKNDLEPGPITIWKGWRRLFDLAEGWRLAHELYICG